MSETVNDPSSVANPKLHAQDSLEPHVSGRYKFPFLACIFTHGSVIMI